MEYGLIGEKLGHSYSKIIHEKLAAYSYELTPLTKEEFTSFMESRNFCGINVTIPYKKEVIPYLDHVDDAARAIGAVNTIVHRDGKLWGYNTDCPGFIYMMKRTGVNVAGKKALVLGTGGGAQAILAALRREGADPILSVSRTGKDGAITYDQCAHLHTDAQIIVNTTPAGMYPHVDASPMDLTPFTACEAVLDIVYNPSETKLTAQAKRLGMKAATGLSMLVAQAKYACDIFTGQTLDDSLIDAITEELQHELS